MKNIHVFCDFDGTITDHDTLVFLATQLGGGLDLVRRVGEELRSGRMSLRDGIAEEMRSVRLPFSEVARILRSEISLDPGFASLVDLCRSNSIHFTILSAGFREIIELFVPATEFPSVTVLANHIEADVERGWQCRFRDASVWGHDKGESIRAAQNRGEYAVFIGDGFSDRQAAELADDVYAKHSLTDYCREHGIAFTEYRTLADVERKIYLSLNKGATLRLRRDWIDTGEL